MRKTAKLKLGGHTWQVERHDLEDEDFWGQTLHSQHRIRLHDKLEGSHLDEILIHECIHAVDGTHELGLTEAQVRSLGVGLQQMLAPFLKVKGV